MKKVLLYLLVALLAPFATLSAQQTITLTGSIEEELTPGVTYNFYDSGGPTGNYGTSQSYTATLTASGNITINFSALETESSSGCYNWDYMLIYDGDATDGTLIGRAQSGCSTATITTGVDYVATSGTLTIEWHSDGSTTKSGWEATIVAQAGSGQTCTKPSDFAVSGITAHGATLTWDGGQEGALYSVRYIKSSENTGNDPKWTTVPLATGLEKTATLSGLEPNTAYTADVKCVCGVDLVSGARTLNFTTPMVLPLSEKFASTSLPSGWSRYSGLLSDVMGGTALVSITSGWNFGTANGVFDNHAKVNVYGTSVKYWLVSPAFEVVENAQLTFDLALTAYSGTLGAPVASGSDDKFVVLITVDNGATWTILRQWDNAGSADVYNDIPATAAGQEQIFDLTAYVGNSAQIAFYTESTVSNADNNLHLDNVRVGVPLNCQKPVSLKEVASGISKNTIQVEWTSDDALAWKVQYKKSSASAWQSLPAADTTLTISGLDPLTTYNVRVAALCNPADETSITDYTDEISVTTATGVPYAQPFTKSTLPSDWKRYQAALEEVQSGAAELEAVSAGWAAVYKTYANANGIFPDSTYHLYINLQGDAIHHWIVSPAIEIEAGFELSFNMALTKKAGGAVVAGEQNSEKFAVLVYADGEWDELGAWASTGGTAKPFDQINSTSEGEVAKFDLNLYAGKTIQLAFYGESTDANDADNNLHISGVKIDTIPACPPPTSLSIAEAGSTTAQIVWTGDAGGVWQYGYVANPAEDFEPAEADFAHETSGKVADLTGLDECTKYIFFLRHACDGGNSEVWTRTFTTMQTPATLPYSADFEENNGGWIFENGTQTNAWFWGTATANGGTHAIYISNDNGATNDYTISSAASMVFATKVFYFDEVGTYSFSFDWKGVGENSSDYLRVALVPTTVEPVAGTAPSGFSSTALPSGWVALDGGSKLNLQSEWQNHSFDYAISQVGYYKVILAWKNDGSVGETPPAAIDNFSIFRMNCTKPIGLAVTDLTAQQATLAWNDESDASSWVYAYALATAEEPADDAFLPITNNSIELTELTAETAYKFYLRHACGADVFSESVVASFTTTAVPATLPFEDDFEGSEIAWELINGTLPNAWVVDTAAHNGGTHALYISNDNGVSNAYTTGSASTVYASKLFRFEVGTYTISYDWKGYGESNYDLLRVALVPASIQLEASSSMPAGLSSTSGTALATELPANWIALDGGSKLNLSSAWATKKVELEVTTAASYYVVFLWRNDGSGGTTPPAAVDNISIRRVLCTTPANLQIVADSTSTTAAFLKWEPQGEEANWLVRYKVSGDAQWADSIQTTEDSLWLTNLLPATTYEVQVAGWCDPTDVETISEFSASISFATECEAVATLNEGFEGSLLCWSAITETNSYGTYPAPIVEADYAHDGEKAMYFLSLASGTPNDQYGITPELISLDNKRVRFYARKEDAGDEDINIAVGVMTDPADVSTFVSLASLPLNSTTYAPYVVPFTSYTGEGKYVAVKMPASTVDYATLILDDVVIEEIPQCVDPADLQAIPDSLTPSSAVLAWTPQGDEANWLVRYRVSGAEAWADTLAATNDTLKIEGLAAATTYEVQVAAWCNPTDDEAVSPFSGIVSFTTACEVIEAFPWHVDFQTMEASTVPLCWDNSASTSSTLASNPGHIFGVYEYSGNKMLRMYNYYVNNGSALINTPVIVLPEGAQYELTFDYAHTATCGDMTVKISTNGGVSFTALSPVYGKTSTGTDKDNPGEFTEVVINLADYAGDSIILQFYADANFGSGAIFVDNVDVHPVPTCFKPSNLKVELTRGNGTVATINWSTNSDESAWVLEYGTKADFSNATQMEANDSTVNLTGLMPDSTYYARVKAVCSETDESYWSNSISFVPTNDIIINDSTATNSYVPFYGYYVNYGAQSQFVVPASEINMIAWDSITSLTFYSSTATAALTGAKFDVYFAEVPFDSIAEMTDWSAMTKVVSDKHLAVASNQMTVALDRPYQYAGGNLLIGFKLSTPASSYGSSISWYGKSNVAGASMAGYSSSASYTYAPSQRNFAPKMKINHVHGEMPTCFKVKDVAVSGITASSATLSWTNGAEGQDAWQIVYTADPDFNIAEATDENIINAASNPYALAELLTDTTYYVYVRANCGEEDGVSVWSDVFSFRTASACQAPDDLAAADITISSASISWNDYGQTGFNLRYGLDGINWLDTIENVASPYLLNELEDATIYYVQVQIACNAEAWSDSIFFQTSQIPATVPFVEDFESGNKWTLINGDLANAWAYGTAAHNGEGTHALYVSNTKGATNAYNTSAAATVFAVKLISLEAANYSFRYDWKGYGESSYDLLRVALVPDSIELEASSAMLPGLSSTGGSALASELPANWIALDGGSKLNLSNAWNTHAQDVEIEHAGLYKLVLLWRNDNSSGSTPPAAVDNINVRRLTCLKPSGLAASQIKAHSAELSWHPGEASQSEWQIAIDTLIGFNPDTLSTKIDVIDSSYVISGLLADKNYYVYVRANCGTEDGMSDWSARASFKTTVACPAPKSLEAVLTPGDGSVATINWKAGQDENAWVLEYSTNANMTDSTVYEASDSTYFLTGLTAETTYYVRVKADCGELDGESSYSAVISFTTTNAYLLTINDGTATNSYVPVYGYYADYGTYSQFVIPEDLLEEIEWDSIHALTFYSSTATANWGAAQFKVYFAESDEATISAWNNFSSMTEVMSEGTLSIADGKMVVTLDEPYHYQGGHLLIGFEQTVLGTDVQVSWYGKTAQGASMSYHSSYSKTQRNFLPKMTIEYAPGVAPSCPAPKKLAVSDITAYGATFSWKAIEGAAWEYALANAGEEVPAEWTATAENSVVLDNLDELTSYVFYLRRACEENEYSDTVSLAFATIEFAQALPYVENFEGASSWKFSNGANAWVIGNATANLGEQALYISNDGVSYGYDATVTTVSYASKLFNFNETGTYTISYDWKDAGDYSVEDERPFDYLRVALVPGAVELTADVQPAGLTPSALPAGWISLDQDTALIGAEDWQHISVVAALPAIGLYKVVFIWVNDDDFTDGVPAAIDNLSIVHKNYPTGFGGTDAEGVKAVKFIRGNHVYILVNGVIYDATGRRVE